MFSIDPIVSTFSSLSLFMYTKSVFSSIFDYNGNLIIPYLFKINTKKFKESAQAPFELIFSI
jgi:hypothetical protein